MLRTTGQMLTWTWPLVCGECKWQWALLELPYKWLKTVFHIVLSNFFHICLLLSVDLKLCCNLSLFSCTRSKLRCSQQVFTDGFSGEHLVKPKQPQKPHNHPEVSEVLKVRVGCLLGKHIHLDCLKQMSLFMRVSSLGQNQWISSPENAKIEWGNTLGNFLIYLTLEVVVSAIVVFHVQIVISTCHFAGIPSICISAWKFTELS